MISTVFLSLFAAVATAAVNPRDLTITVTSVVTTVIPTTILPSCPPITTIVPVPTTDTCKTATVTEIASFTTTVYPSYPYPNQTSSNPTSVSTAPTPTRTKVATYNSTLFFNFDRPVLTPSNPSLYTSNIQNISFFAGFGTGPSGAQIYLPSSGSPRYSGLHSGSQLIVLTDGGLQIQPGMGCVLDMHYFYIHADIAEGQEMRLNFRAGGMDCWEGDPGCSERWVTRGNAVLKGPLEGPVVVKPGEGELMGPGRWDELRYWDISANLYEDDVHRGSVEITMDDLELRKVCGPWVPLQMP